MYNFFVDLFIWSFAIYGFINFINEFILDIFYYIIIAFVNMAIFFKKFIAKFSR